jgi:hypothetical protein
MSRIGKQPITVPSGVDVTIAGAHVTVKGPKGQLEHEIIGGVTIIVDRFSLPYLEGASVDYVDGLMGQGFTVENPNASASCGEAWMCSTSGGISATSWRPVCRIVVS